MSCGRKPAKYQRRSRYTKKEDEMAWTHTQEIWWQCCQAITTVDTTRPLRKKATQSWIEWSALWLMLHWERQGRSQVSQPPLIFRFSCVRNRLCWLPISFSFHYTCIAMYYPIVLYRKPISYAIDANQFYILSFWLVGNSIKPICTKTSAVKLYNLTLTLCRQCVGL